MSLNEWHDAPTNMSFTAKYVNHHIIVTVTDLDRKAVYTILEGDIPCVSSIVRMEFGVDLAEALS